MPIHTLLLLAFLQISPAGEPLRSSCSSEAEPVSEVAATDRVQVISALAGEGKPCYKITVSRPGQDLTGYVLGDRLSAVRDFERQREKASEAATEAQARLAAAQAATAAAAQKSDQKEPEKPKDPLISTQFKDFSGLDFRGNAVSLSGLKGRVTLVTFWSPNSAQGRSQVMYVMPLYNELHKSGLAAVSVAMDPNPNRITSALDEVTPAWPQMPDRSGLAAHYNVDPKAGKVFVLDSSHRIVAAGPMGPDIEKAVRQLLASP